MIILFLYHPEKKEMSARPDILPRLISEEKKRRDSSRSRLKGEKERGCSFSCGGKSGSPGRLFPRSKEGYLPLCVRAREGGRKALLLYRWGKSKRCCWPDRKDDLSPIQKELKEREKGGLVSPYPFLGKKKKGRSASTVFISCRQGRNEKRKAGLLAS